MMLRMVYVDSMTSLSPKKRMDVVVVMEYTTRAVRILSYFLEVTVPSILQELVGK